MSDTIESAVIRFAWIWPIALCIGIGVVLAAMLMNGTREEKVHALCDKEVEALLHSNDLVEVTRAGILVRYMNCGVGSRLVDSGCQRVGKGSGGGCF